MAGPTKQDLEQKVAGYEAQVADLTARLEAATETAEPVEKPANVIQAILAVMRDVRAVGKDGYNEQHRFNFRGIDGTVNALGPSFREHGLVVLPYLRSLTSEQVETGAKRTRMNWTRVEVEYRFYGPGGADDTITVVTPGESFDAGDKGTAKAMSVAFRTALLQAFALPTQERDPDADAHELSPKLSGSDLRAEVDNAVEQAAVEGRDRVQALKAVWDKYGESALQGVTVEKGGETMTAAAYINGWVAHLRAQPAQPPAQQPAQPAAQSAPAPAQPAQPAQPAPAQRPAPDARPVDPIFTPLYSEIEGQAAVLGVPVAEYVKPLLASSKGAEKVSDVLAPIVLTWVADQRPAVIDALRGLGRATEADTYAQVPNGQARMWEQLTGTTAGEREDTRAPQDA